jgi:cytochrome c553
MVLYIPVYALRNTRPAVSNLPGSSTSYRFFRHRCWKRNARLALGTFALLASVKTVYADQGNETSVQRIGNGNPVAGKQKAEAERCQECHGETGNSHDDRIPSHAGQYAGYLIKQIQNFQSGQRRYEIMNKMVADLNPVDTADIAAYFAQQAPMQGKGPVNNSLGKNLFLNGDNARDIPSCVSCHGDSGKGRVADNVIYPLIAGQREHYLRRELLYWKLGERNNSPDAVMNQVTKSLTTEEIEALAAYISGL